MIEVLGFRGPVFDVGQAELLTYRSLTTLRGFEALTCFVQQFGLNFNNINPGNTPR